MTRHMLKLGTRAQDKITGFTGIVTARAEYLNGCVTYKLQPEKLTADGAVVKGDWFDEQQLIDDSKAEAGGPQERPPEMHP